MTTPQPWEYLFGLSNIRSIIPEGGPGVAKRYDQQVQVDLDGGMPAVFSWNGRSYRVVDVIGRWRIEGRWWEDGRDREYWRVEVKGGAVCDLYRDHLAGRWHLERLWD